MREISHLRAGEPVGSVRRWGRRHSSYALALGGGLHANVINGILVGFGVEPIDGPVVDGGPGRGRLMLAWAAPIAGAAAAGAAVATGFVLRHRRVA